MTRASLLFAPAVSLKRASVLSKGEIFPSGQLLIGAAGARIIIEFLESLPAAVVGFGYPVTPTSMHNVETLKIGYGQIGPGFVHIDLADRVERARLFLGAPRRNYGPIQTRLMGPLGG